MKLKLSVALLIVVLTTAFASAQFSPQLYPAGTVFKGKANFFGNVGIYDDAKTIVGAIKYGVGGYTDIDVRLGYIDVDGGGDDGMILASNFRYQLMEVRIKDPLDFSVGGYFETILGWDDSNFKLGAFAVGSRPIALNDEKDLVPFGRLILRYDKYGDNDDVNIGLNLGSKYDLNPSTALSAEFQFDDQFGFILGVIFEM